MEFVFWQNIIAIHQKALLTELSRLHKVSLVVEQESYQFRLEQGWNVPDMGDVNIIVAPQADKLDHLLLKFREAIHIFSGFQTYRTTHFAFLFALNNRLKTLVYTEPYDLQGIRGMVRRIRLMISRQRFGNKVDGILVTGDLGHRCFSEAGFDENKIFDFGYFTESPKSTFGNHNTGEIPEPDLQFRKPDLLYVGSIDERKNILNLVRVCKKLHGRFNTFDIIGRGNLEAELQKEISDAPDIHFLGSMDNAEVQGFMHRKDILILPSFFDGWGAVVNEALEHGMRVLASDMCGSSVLLDGKHRGAVFSLNSNNMESVLEHWISRGKHSVSERTDIIRWCKASISGKVAAAYLISLCNYIYNGSPVRPVAPWLKTRR